MARGVCAASRALRLPTAPLWERLKVHLCEDPHLELVASGEVTVAMVGRALGITFHQAAKLRYSETIAHDRADLLASRLGLHPSAIWGDDYYRLTEVDGHPYVDPNDPKEE